MFFTNPLVLWLLPLAVTPFLLRMRYFIESGIQEVPSLFFLEKLLQRKQLRYEKPLLETLLEALFICLAIFIWSGPQSNTSVRENDSLLVLVDDSPSMQYYYGKYSGHDEQLSLSPSKLQGFLDMALQNQSFQSIDLARLSALDKAQLFPVKKTQDFQDYFLALAEQEKSSPWNVESLVQGLTLTKKGAAETSKSLLLYSDFKENHFLPQNKAASFSAKRKADILDNFKQSGFNLFYLKENPAPYVHHFRLNRRNFFIRETLSLPLKVSLSHDNQMPIFLEVLMNGERAYLNKIDSNNNDDDDNIDSISADNAADSSLERSFQVDINFDTLGVNFLSIVLKKDDYVFYRRNQAFFVHPRNSISISSPSPEAAETVAAIFSYDEDAEKISLSKADGDIRIILAPSQIAGSKLQEFRNNRKKQILVLDPNADFFEQTRALKDLGLADLRFESIEHTSIRSRYYWSKQEQVENLFNEDELKNRSFIKLSAASSQLVQPLLEVDGHAVIFRYKDTVCMSLISLEELAYFADAHHLIWLYEAFFSLSGAKKLSIIENPDIFTKRIALKANPSTTPSVLLGDRLWIDQQEVLLESVPPLEYQSPVMQAALTEETIDFFNSANYIQSHSASSKAESTHFLSIIEFLLLLCFILLLFLFFLYFKKFFQEQKEDELEKLSH